MKKENVIKNEERIVEEVIDEEIYQQIKNEMWKTCNLKEKIIIKMARKLFVNTYRKGMQDYFNLINKF